MQGLNFILKQANSAIGHAENQFVYGGHIGVRSAYPKLALLAQVSLNVSLKLGAILL